MPESAHTLPRVTIPPHALAEWRLLAAVLAEYGPAPCESADAEAWWPTAGQAVDPLALRCCQECPARAECLAYALAAGEPEGVWGGLLPAERRALGRDAA